MAASRPGWSVYRSGCIPSTMPGTWKIPVAAGCSDWRCSAATRWSRPRVVAAVSSEVSSPRMTSTSCITGTGFMKCIPMKRCGRLTAPAISVGLSNVSNAVPGENRSLINRVYCAMLMGAGLKMMIASPFDKELKDYLFTEDETAHG